MATAAHKVSPTVRVEAADSIGRSYTAADTITSNIKRGLGAARRTLDSRTFDPAREEALVLESATLALVHMSRASRQDVLDYFHNTWAMTDALFAGLLNDAVFYMVRTRGDAVALRARARA